MKLYLVRCIYDNPTSMSPDKVGVVAANDEDSARRIFEHEFESLIKNDRQEWSLLSESAAPGVEEGIVVDALSY